MIKFRLRKYMRDRLISEQQLKNLTGIRWETIIAYYDGYVKRFNKTDLNKICKALDCQITDIIEYVPDKKS